MPTKSKKISLPIISTKKLVLYPGNITSLTVERKESQKALKISLDEYSSLIVIVCQKNESKEMKQMDDVFSIGVIAKINNLSEHNALIRSRIEVVGRCSIESIEYNNDKFAYFAEVKCLPEIKENEEMVDKDFQKIYERLQAFPNVFNNLPKSITNHLYSTTQKKMVSLAYQICFYVDTSVKLKQTALESKTYESLMKNTHLIIESIQINKDIDNEVEKDLADSTAKSQKEYFIREKMKSLRKQLGEDDNSEDPETILKNAEEKPYPEYVKKKIRAEVKKYQMMPSGSLESALILSYLNVLTSIPWWEKSEDNDDLNNVEKILNEDHYGLETPKKRIIEYLAVKKLTGTLKAPILCFYGPPGTGKTSLGKSIARALGRKFFKTALGGISDEAEIRGHRRTYVGSLPGRIIEGMRKAKTTNPVFLLDEIDKLASSYKGDPASALLEVLDPEQNIIFNDNYVEEPYDLSNVLFICTANYLEQIPAPLRDRLELIELSSYTDLEKNQIAKDHLIKKQTELNGLRVEQVSFTEDAIPYIIRAYTREAGVRELERKIASCIRKVAVTIVKDPTIKHIDIDSKKVREYLGPEIFVDTGKEKEKLVGIVTGLAYTQYGGDTLPIEANKFKGKGNIMVTGNLGNVMKESCQIAFSYVKANCEKYDIKSEDIENIDIHIHFPEGAVPKDGPSAGVAITLAIISCLTNTPVSPDVAMTGEVDLRGRAMPIGGLKEKSLAAYRSGIKTIIIPKENERDLENISKEVKEKLKIVLMETVEDAIKIAFCKK